MNSMIYDAILIVLISIFTALLGEGGCQEKETGLLLRVSSCLFCSLSSPGLTWLLVYRTEKYQRLKNEVEKQCKKCKSLNDPS